MKLFFQDQDRGLMAFVHFVKLFLFILGMCMRRCFSSVITVVLLNVNFSVDPLPLITRSQRVINQDVADGFCALFEPHLVMGISHPDAFIQTCNNHSNFRQSSENYLWPS